MSADSDTTPTKIESEENRSKPPLPREFGDFVLEEEIGRGGMGVVYRARQVSLNRWVAIKVIQGEPSTISIERFKREAEAAARLDHPLIVPVFEVGEHEKQPYFSMGLVQGSNLRAVASSYRNDPQAAARLVASSAWAVHHAHRRGLIHRDLKPSNLIVDAAGLPHVTDFGLVRFMEEDRTLTRPGTVMGTPNYMSPEQARGLDSVGPSTDVYGLGAVLYDLLTGRPPFVGDTADTLVAVLNDTPAPPRSLVRTVPPELEAIALKCLEKEPAARYSSAAELASDLERWLVHEPILAKPSSHWVRLRKWALRKPDFIAGLALTAISLTVISLVVKLQVEKAAEGMEFFAKVGMSERARALAERSNAHLRELRTELRVLARAAPRQQDSEQFDVIWLVGRRDVTRVFTRPAKSAELARLGLVSAPEARPDEQRYEERARFVAQKGLINFQTDGNSYRLFLVTPSTPVLAVYEPLPTGVGLLVGVAALDTWWADLAATAVESPFSAGLADAGPRWVAHSDAGRRPGSAPDERVAEVVTHDLKRSGFALKSLAATGRIPARLVAFASLVELSGLVVVLEIPEEAAYHAARAYRRNTRVALVAAQLVVILIALAVTHRRIRSRRPAMG